MKKIITLILLFSFHINGFGDQSKTECVFYYSSLGYWTGHIEFYLFEEGSYFKISKGGSLNNSSGISKEEGLYYLNDIKMLINELKNDGLFSLSSDLIEKKMKLEYANQSMNVSDGLTHGIECIVDGKWFSISFSAVEQHAAKYPKVNELRLLSDSFSEIGGYLQGLSSKANK